LDYTLINKKKILITGSGSRFAGSLKQFLYGKNIFYTDKKKFNILDLTSIEFYLNKYKPDYIIHLAALSRPMIVHEKDIGSSIDVNIIGTANIVKKCSEKNIKLIFFSTNYVYPGNKGNYKEEDPLYPVNNYAWSKLGGEACVKLYKNSLILRLAMTEYPFIHDKAFTDAKTNFIYREEVIKILPYLIDEFGIINVGSTITESLFSFAKKTKKNVKPISIKNIKNFPRNSSVNIDRLKKIINKSGLKVNDRRNIKTLMNQKQKILLTSEPSITQLEREIVDDMMRFGWNNLNYLKKFEEEFASYHNRKYCLMTPSFKMAFFLSLKTLEIEKGDEIIFPELTNNIFNKEILKMKIKPKFTEIDNKNCCISINSLKKIINKKTKVVICENIFGETPNINEIKKICKKNKNFLIEDISDAVGLKNENKINGKLGDISICNFSTDKIITCGEGGAILTDNLQIYQKARQIIDGKNLTNAKQNIDNLNLCFTPSNFQAAMIYGQFKRLGELVRIKKKLLGYYKKNLQELSINLRGTTYIVLEFDKKYLIKTNMLIKFLEKNKIHAKKLHKPFPSRIKKGTSSTQKFYRNSVILPSNFNLNEQDIKFITDMIKHFLKNNI
tara:strand:+ start:1679 stop:3520 length:1842 start_codon:yes stop_codon:yes gene_type:complete